MYTISCILIDATWFKPSTIDIICNILSKSMNQLNKRIL